MTERLYSVVLEGAALDGFDSKETQNRLEQLLKTTPDIAKRLLSGNEVVITKNLNLTVGEQYLNILKGAGVKCHLQISAQTNIFTEQVSVNTTEKQNTEPNRTDEVAPAPSSSQSVRLTGQGADSQLVSGWRHYRSIIFKWVLPVAMVLLVSFSMRGQVLSRIADEAISDVSGKMLTNIGKYCDQSDYPQPITFENTAIPAGMKLKSSDICKLGNALYNSIHAQNVTAQQNILGGLCDPVIQFINKAGSVPAALEKTKELQDDPNAPSMANMIMLCQDGEAGDKARQNMIDKTDKSIGLGIYSIGTLTSPKSGKTCLAFLDSQDYPKIGHKYQLHVMACDLDNIKDVNAIDYQARHYEITKVYKYTGAIPQYYTLRGEKKPFIEEDPLETAIKNQAEYLSKTYSDPDIPANQITPANLGSSIESIIAGTLKLSSNDIAEKLKSLKIISTALQTSPESMDSFIFSTPANAFGIPIKGVNLATVAAHGPGSGPPHDIEFMVDKPVNEVDSIQKILDGKNIPKDRASVGTNGIMSDKPQYPVIVPANSNTEDRLPIQLDDRMVNMWIYRMPHDDPSYSSQVLKIVHAEIDGKYETQDAVTVWCNLGPSPQSVTCSLTLFLLGKQGISQSDNTNLDGQFDSMEVKDGVVTIHAKAYGQNDAGCCPTINTTHQYIFQKGSFIEKNKY